MNIKTKILLTLVMGGVIVIFVVGGRWKILGNMRNNIREVKTSNSDFSFAGNKGDCIKISLRTTVRNGTVDFILSDSKGNVVEKLDRAKALETFVNLSYDDTYTVTAIYKEFTGKFSIKVRKRRF